MNSHEELKERLITANRCYFGLLTLFKLKLLSKRSNITLYKVLIRPTSLYACETWEITKTDEKKFGVFESMDQKRMKKLNLKLGQMKNNF